jgi:hypothetical protein
MSGAFVGLLLCFYALCVFLFLAKGASFIRRLRATVLFFVFEMLVGGAVSFFYTLLDNFLAPHLMEGELNAPNRRLLTLSLLILLSFGVIKLLSHLFSHSRTEASAELEIRLLGRRLVLDGLADSGNLLKDPMSSRAVILIKYEKMQELCPDFPRSVDQLSALGGALVSRIVLVPSDKRIYIGIRPDRIYISEHSKRKHYCIDAVIASDTEGGNFGGYFALIPTAVLD